MLIIIMLAKNEDDIWKHLDVDLDYSKMLFREAVE